MIISHTKKFIYFKIGKTAGTSTEMFFEQFCDKNIDIVGWRGEPPIPEGTTFWNHMKPCHVKPHVTKQQWESYFKFANIRNTWDRMVSKFFWMKKRDTIDSNSTFYDFINSQFPIENLYKHYQCKQNIMNTFISFENLKEDIQYVCDKLNIKANITNLPHVHQTDHKNYREYYTEETKNIVLNRYKDEINFFKYDF